MTKWQKFTKNYKDDKNDNRDKSIKVQKYKKTKIQKDKNHNPHKCDVIIVSIMLHAKTLSDYMNKNYIRIKSHTTHANNFWMGLCPFLAPQKHPNLP